MDKVNDVGGSKGEQEAAERANQIMELQELLEKKRALLDVITYIHTITYTHSNCINKLYIKCGHVRSLHLNLSLPPPVYFVRHMTVIFVSFSVS
jgi:hypothetical protein